MQTTSPEDEGDDAATIHTELWSAGATAMMIALLNAVMRAWSCQASSPVPPAWEAPPASSLPIQTSVVARHELRALSLDLSRWMQRWSGAWGGSDGAGVAGIQEVVSAAAENMVLTISALDTTPPGHAIPGVATVGAARMGEPTAALAVAPPGMPSSPTPAPWTSYPHEQPEAEGSSALQASSFLHSASSPYFLPHLVPPFT
jgi:hypothetical protein